MFKRRFRWPFIPLEVGVCVCVCVCVCVDRDITAYHLLLKNNKAANAMFHIQ